MERSSPCRGLVSGCDRRQVWRPRAILRISDETTRVSLDHDRRLHRVHRRRGERYQEGWSPV